MVDREHPLGGVYDAWKGEGHVQLFDVWSRVPLFVLRDRFERCHEVKLLASSLQEKNRVGSLLEVGCATGEFFRYFTSRFPQVSYVGCDISHPAIRRAQEKYGQKGRFLHTDEHLVAVKDLVPDVLFLS